MPTFTTIRTPGGEVSRIPELLNVIIAHLNRSDQAKIMRVSRPLFRCAGALVWRDIVGITKLFSLLPGAAIRVDRQSVNRGPNLMVIVSNFFKVFSSGSLNQFLKDHQASRLAGLH